jgi:predicted RNA-binding protein associated with RNAse of E/G family
MDEIRVLKKNLAGEVTWQYTGRVLRREPATVTLEAYFNRDDMAFLDIMLKHGDRFVETFYSDRWYNIFEIYDRDSGERKGWYCNVGRPGVLTESTVAYVDLALDLWVSDDGRQSVLDEDEFTSLALEPRERDQALKALAELQRLFQTQRPP